MLVAYQYGHQLVPVGTAVLIDETLAVTCYHVIDEEKQGYLILFNRKSETRFVGFSIHRADKNIDAAVLQLQRPVGFEPAVSLGKEWKWDQRGYLAVRIWKKRKPFLLDNVWFRGADRAYAAEPVAGGDSGSGIYDREGRLVAIVKNHRSGNPCVLGVVTAQQLRFLLHE